MRIVFFFVKVFSLKTFLLYFYFLRNIVAC